jgi:orotate phosphoribosyltransferase
MDDAAIMKTLSDVGAVISNSHIVYTSGRHGEAYVNKDALYLHPAITSQLCKLMAEKYDVSKVDVVAGPTIGGVILSQWVAYHMNLIRSAGETLSIYVEKDGEGDDKGFVIKRGYDKYVPGKNVVVVEDILNTGGSARKVVETIKAMGGNVLGLSVLCNRGGIKPEDVGGAQINALANISLESWTEEDCTLCKNNVPINTSVGKGKEFLARR